MKINTEVHIPSKSCKKYITPMVYRVQMHRYLCMQMNKESHTTRYKIATIKCQELKADDRIFYKLEITINLHSYRYIERSNTHRFTFIYNFSRSCSRFKQNANIFGLLHLSLCTKVVCIIKCLHYL